MPRHQVTPSVLIDALTPRLTGRIRRRARTVCTPCGRRANILGPQQSQHLPTCFSKEGADSNAV